MLQHSRGGSGQLDPTPLNPLIKEYVNLAFHGMRAAQNPINVDIRFELDETIQDVPLFAEDFSRVILNICNNAFDAMRDKSEKAPKGRDWEQHPTKGKSEKNSPPEGSASPESLREKRGVLPSQSYNPKLTIRTRQNGSSYIIEFEDNGPGIPDDIKDKILQPFFTTKKGTAGTGLGMSITHDIVKAHKGTITIESETGNGTTFKITLDKGQG
jgi:signal transduction histidine kinase